MENKPISKINNMTQLVMKLEKRKSYRGRKIGN
jgi:hypothetical protein